MCAGRAGRCLWFLLLSHPNASGYAAHAHGRMRAEDREIRAHTRRRNESLADDIISRLVILYIYIYLYVYILLSDISVEPPPPPPEKTLPRASQIGLAIGMPRSEGASFQALLEFLSSNGVASRKRAQSKVKRETDSRGLNFCYFRRRSSRSSLLSSIDCVYYTIYMYIILYYTHMPLFTSSQDAFRALVVDVKRNTLPHDSLDGFCLLSFSGSSLLGRRGPPLRRQGLRGTRQPGISLEPNVLPESARVGSPDV